MEAKFIEDTGEIEGMDDRSRDLGFFRSADRKGDYVLSEVGEGGQGRRWWDGSCADLI